MRHQCTCIYPFDGNNILIFEIFIKRHLRHFPGKQFFEVAPDKTFYLDAVTLHIKICNTIITYVYIIHDEHLAIITGIRKYFLVSCHACIETDLSTCCTYGTKGLPVTGCTIFENQNRCLLIHSLKIMQRNYIGKFGNVKLTNIGMATKAPRHKVYREKLLCAS